ncbi:hypothetical protein IFT84_20555 [Rhizobium sp. CFBP 8762]|uniref:hypothetical protein n=1 Tax=Rhizobium sp. CFBP 8762 TaxID=2775279 RepID=UPI0017826722|nr:hypothetical protein [Rhizobium sp. CFBP 8762]MBD8556904.1 hypothetical protein [Rhizobium sp. CFBP 8762]
MSVVRQLVVTSAVEALRGRTVAGDCVYDSRIDSFRGLVNEDGQTALIISCEEAEQDGTAHSDGGFLGRSTELRLLIQAIVVSVSKIKTEDGEALVSDIAETDAAYEAVLNILDRQWRAVLHDYDVAWCRVFRGLVLGVGKIIDTRAVDPEVGRKYACRYTQVSLKVVHEPIPGRNLPPCIEAGLAAMEADGDKGFANIAMNFRAALADGSDQPDWRKLQSRLFATRADMDALLLTPLVTEETLIDDPTHTA